MSLCLPTASVSSRRVLWVDLHARWVVNHAVVFYGVRSVSKRCAFVNQSKCEMAQPLSPRCSGGRRRWHPFRCECAVSWLFPL